MTKEEKIIKYKDPITSFYTTSLLVAYLELKKGRVLRSKEINHITKYKQLKRIKKILKPNKKVWLEILKKYKGDPHSLYNFLSKDNLSEVLFENPLELEMKSEVFTFKVKGKWS